MNRKHERVVQFTVRGVPERVAQVLRNRAAEGHKSVNTVLVEALTAGAGLAEEPVKQRDLTDLAGQWVEDAEFDAALADQDQVDEAMWRSPPEGGTEGGVKRSPPGGTEG